MGIEIGDVLEFLLWKSSVSVMVFLLVGNSCLGAGCLCKYTVRDFIGLSGLLVGYICQMFRMKLVCIVFYCLFLSIRRNS